MCALFFSHVSFTLTPQPSYSETGDFLNYAYALQTFRDICAAAPQPNAITALENLDAGMTCPLHYAAGMLQLISDGLRAHPRVIPFHGTVTRAVRNPAVSTVPRPFSI